MDREIDPTVIKKEDWKRRGWIVVMVLLIIGSLFGLRSLLRTNVEANRLRTAMAEIGRMDNTLNASGEVIPAFEQVITAPIRAEVQEVLASVGTTIEPGTPILALDKSFSELEYEKLKQ